MTTTLQTIELPSGTIEYATYGPDDSAHPPVVFVHGVAVDHRLWEPTAELLAAAGYRCYAPTLPLGAHRIPWGPDADRSPRGAAALIGEFISTLGLSDVTLVGNDTGGALCQFALDADPDLAARVLFTNCDAFEKFPPQPFPVVFALLKQPWALRPLVAGPLQVRAIRHSALGVGLLVTDPDPALTKSVFEPLRTDSRIRDDLSALLRALRPTDLAAITPRLSKVTAPVSVMWGSDDRAFRPALGKRLAEVFEQATFTEIPGSRTFVSLDQPRALADAVAELTRRPVGARG
ncbi:alpha/beta fold hydrolase [Gordonia soli]|uniref:Putative hydrolase n=1 Tax=Gordonia soli NBRC 108243 TaxID=1223545 RepID=M0QPF1_9ACTN|nr:alpha/beta hydrolase [Gordonia soli]GAC70545.1 putative hydrolase [Gordonia soli NBRC 108243]